VAFIISAIFRPPPRQVAEGFFTMLRGLGWPYAHQSPRGGGVRLDPFFPARGSVFRNIEIGA
jgi:hypothetical protein